MPDVFDTLNAALDAKDAPARPAWTALLELHVECDCEGLRGPHCFQSCGAWPCSTATAARGWREAEARADAVDKADSRTIAALQEAFDFEHERAAALAHLVRQMKAGILANAEVVAHERERRERIYDRGRAERDARIAALARRVAALEGDLRTALHHVIEYSFHPPDCPAYDDLLFDCTCEYDDMWNKWAALRDGPPAIETEG